MGVEGLVTWDASFMSPIFYLIMGRSNSEGLSSLLICAQTYHLYTSYNSDALPTCYFPDVCVFFPVITTSPPALLPIQGLF